MIRAIVTVKNAHERIVYDAIGVSSWNIEESARELYGSDDDPCSITVMVQP